MEHPMGWRGTQLPGLGLTSARAELGLAWTVALWLEGGCLGLCCACLCYCMVSYFLIVNKSGLETARGILKCSTLLFLLPGAPHSCRVPEGWRGTFATAYPLVLRLSPCASAAIP